MHILQPSNELMSDPVRLRDQAAHEGVLFIKRLLPAEDVLTVRREILALCEESNWLSDGSNIKEGIAAEGCKCVEPEPAFMEVYDKIQRLESFHGLARHPALTELTGNLFGEEAIGHARNIARVIFPENNDYTTPAHQDYIHIQGTTETWTTWIPLGDCPLELGGLAVLPGSHKQGVFPVKPALGAGGLGIDTDGLPYDWHTAEFGIGDAFIFHSLTVHKGMPNLSGNRIRLSVDFRYQSVSQPAVAASFEPHHGRLSWEDIYSGWKSDENKYYWRNVPLRFVEWSPQYHTPA